MSVEATYSPTLDSTLARLCKKYSGGTIPNLLYAYCLAKSLLKTTDPSTLLRQVLYYQPKMQHLNLSRLTN